MCVHSHGFLGHLAQCFCSPMWIHLFHTCFQCGARSWLVFTLFFVLGDTKLFGASIVSSISTAFSNYFVSMNSFITYYLAGVWFEVHGCIYPRAGCAFVNITLFSRWFQPLKGSHVR